MIDEFLSLPPAARAAWGAFHQQIWDVDTRAFPRAPGDSHSGDGSHSFEACRVADHLVEGVDDLGEARAGVAVLLPAIQHQLVQGGRTVHGRREPVILLDGIDDLPGSRGRSKM